MVSRLDTPVVLEALTEEEAYLLAILKDESGLDLSEFLMRDQTQEDGIFRAWAFQHSWWRCPDQMQISASSRACGKSMGARSRAMAFPFNYPGQEMVITAPLKTHLDLLTANIERAYLDSRLVTEMIQKKQGTGIAITHSPQFHIEFKNGSRIEGKIPLQNGKNVKGIHPTILLMDEAQDYPPQGYKELFETINRSADNRRWLLYGVTKGIRDDFHKFSQPSSQFTVHCFPSMYRPTWTDEERDEKIELYGSTSDPDYKRNILGKPGDSTNNLFILRNLMKNFDLNDDSDYNSSEYYCQKITNSILEEYGNDILNLLDLPLNHKNYKRVWMGMDVGFVNDPSEILTFAETRPKNPTQFTEMKLVSRINLQKIDGFNQAQAIMWLIDFYQPQAFAMDRTGVGLPLLQEVQRFAREDPSVANIIDIIVGYNFSEKILVEVDDSIKRNLNVNHPDYTDDGIKRTVLEASTDELRKLIDNKQLVLPNDPDLIKEFQGQTYQSIQTGGTDLYGRKRTFSKGQVHTLDAARMAILAWKQHSFEASIKKPDNSYTPPVFISF